MDQGEVKGFLAAAAFIVPAAPLESHPHARVDQQAILSLDRSSVVIEYRVVPSFKDGTHMFDHLDTDHDGLITDSEKRAYAAALLRSTRLTVDGKPVVLRPLSVSIPPRSAMAHGVGLMTAKASAPLQLSPRRTHEIDANVGFALFTTGWFIQPYYSSVLARTSLPTLERSSHLLAIRIKIPKFPS